MRFEVETHVASVVVAETRPGRLAAIGGVLESEPGLRVTGAFETGRDACRAIRQHPPDILLLDWNLPDGGVMAFLRRLDPGPHLNVILLTDERRADVLAEAAILGARGAISGSVPGIVLVRCVRAVLAGDLWFSRRVTRALRDRIASEGLEIRRPHRFLEDVLTPREADVVRWVGSGRTNQEIADELGISHQTVRHHLKSVFGKLHVSSRLELALLVERERL